MEIRNGIGICTFIQKHLRYLITVIIVGAHIRAHKNRRKSAGICFIYISTVIDQKFHYIGNSSLSGAYAMLLSREAQEKVGQIARNMTYVELSNEPTYMDEFVASCFLPHTDASLFPTLEMK